MVWWSVILAVNRFRPDVPVHSRMINISPPQDTATYSRPRGRTRKRGKNGEKKGEIWCSQVLLSTRQAPPLCRNVPLFSHSRTMQRSSKGGFSQFAVQFIVPRNNPVAKTLRFTRRRRSSWLPVDTEFIFHAPLSRGFDVSSAPINPRVQVAAIVSSVRPSDMLYDPVFGRRDSRKLYLYLSIYVCLSLVLSVRNVKFQRASRKIRRGGWWGGIYLVFTKGWLPAAACFLRFFPFHAQHRSRRKTLGC